MENIDHTPFEPVDPILMQRLGPLLKGLRYGSIHLVVHEGRVTQIERVEKVRLEKRKKLDQTTGEISEKEEGGNS